MALNFPLSPSNGDLYNAPNGVTYIYDSISGYWNVQADDPGIVADGAITPAKLSVGGPTWNSEYKIGINTENPVTMFHITGLPGTDPTIRMVDGDTAGYYELVNNAGSVELHADKGNSVAGTFLSISLDGSEFLRVTEYGMLGLGTTTPQQSFHLQHPTGDSNILIQGLTNSTNYVFFGDNESASQGIVSYDHNTDSFGIGTAGTERMKITSDGDVGIGTSSPGRPLHISNSSPVIRLQDTDGTNTYGEIFQATGALYIDSRNGDNPGQIIFRQQGGTTTETMRINSNGDVGIGTSAPGVSLDIRRAGENAIVKAERTDATIAGQVRMGSGDTTNFITSYGDKPLFFGTDNTERMRITSDGFVGIGTSAPQRPLHIRDSNAALRLQDADGTSQLTEIIQQNGATYYDNRNNTGGGDHIFRTWNGTTQQQRFRIKPSGIVNLSTVPVHADNTAAKAGGMVDGDVYRKSDGTLMIVFT